MASVWYTWADTGSTTMTTASSVWQTWTASTFTTATTSTSGDIWYAWATNGVSSPGTYTATSTERAPLTPEQIAERERITAESNARYAESERKRKAAEARAEALLVENLSLRQREELAAYGHFIVHGRNARYRVRRGRGGNIDVVGKDGRISHRMCIHPSEYVPDPDTMLAQKLHLEYDEEAFVRRSNRHSAFVDATTPPVLPALQ